ncbi:MAG: substrate-binding domain-containing protein, partial [Clostridiales bacterium]|nr:substrate-binding domain-containing protein [Clostridiales bacterium]
IYKIRGNGTLIKQSMSPLLRQDTNALPLYGLIVPDFDTTFPRRIRGGVQKYCNEHGVGLIHICSDGISSEEEKAIKLLKNLNCNGVIIMPTDKDNYNNGILELVMGKFPTVLVDRTLFGLHLSCVSSDHFEIGYKATKHLLKKHSDICMITLTTMVTAITERIKGFDTAMAEAGKTANKHRMILQDYDDAQVIAYMEDFFRERPQITGVICNSGHLTLLLLKAMKQLHKKLMQDYELVVIDNNSRDAEFLLDTTIPTIEQDAEAIGYAAAEILSRHLTDGEIEINQKIPLLCDLSDA